MHAGTGWVGSCPESTRSLTRLPDSFLAGYQSLDYEYQALQLGNARYILKASDFSNLLEEEGFALAFVGKELAQIRNQTPLEAQVVMAFSVFRIELRAQLIQGRMPLAELIRESGFDLDIEKNMLVLLCFPLSSDWFFRCFRVYCTTQKH